MSRETPLTFLIIDDNEADHIISKIAIEEYNATINALSVFDGQEALDLLDTMEALPDIILLDINMPGMDGHEFLAEYSKSTKTSVVIAMLTSSSQQVDKQQCMKYSFVKHYIYKPLEPNDVKIIVESLSKNP